MTAKRSRANPNITLAVLSLGSLAYAVLSAVVIPALPTLQHDLHTSETGITWVMTSYLLAASAGTSILGRLGDMYGKERVLLWTLAILAGGTLLGAVGNSLIVIVIARALQGAAGGIFPLAFGIVRDEFPRERVAGSIGLLSAILGVGGGLGIVSSGLIIQHLNWHWLFWIPLIVILIAAVFTWRYVPESPMRVPGRINWRAALVMTVGISTALLAISETTTWGWGSVKTIALLAAGLAICVLWVMIEVRSRRAAGRHDDDAHPRGLDDEHRRLPARRRDVLVVHHHPPVRAAAAEHRLRLRGLRRRLGPLPAAADRRDDGDEPDGGAARGSLRIARGAARRHAL